MSKFVDKVIGNETRIVYANIFSPKQCPYREERVEIEAKCKQTGKLCNTLCFANDCKTAYMLMFPDHCILEEC